MPKLKSSNSSIDSGTFDGFDDPEDHFYDEPLLSSYDYRFTDNGNYRNESSSSSCVTNSSSHLSSSSSSSSSVIESLLLKSCSNYKPLDNLIEDPKPSSFTDRPSSSTSSDSLTSTGPITIKKPKIRPPKPPRHINNSTTKKLINQSVNSQLPLTLPPKGVRSLPTESSSSSSKQSDNTVPPQSTIRTSSPPPPPLPPPSTSRKPSRPPPPIPQEESPISPPSTIQDTNNKVTTSMAVLNRSRSSQGPFYETAFDSKTSFHDALHRGRTNQLSQDRQSSIKMAYHSNHPFHRSTECNLSDTFITEAANSSRSSTASSTSSSTGHDSSRSSTPKHLDNLASSLFPRRHPIKSSVQIPRSKSNDVTLNLLAAVANSSPANQTDAPSAPSYEPRSPSVTNHQSGEQLNKRNQQNTKRATLSTFSMVKSTTSDMLSTFDFESGYVLTRTRSNLDSLRLSMQDRNKKVKDTSSSIASNDNPNSMKFDKPPANRSVCRLNLKLDETRLSNSSSTKLQSPLTDTRPLDDYDTPWDSNQRLNKVFDKLVNTPSNEKDGLSSLAVSSSVIKSETETSEKDSATLPHANHENTRRPGESEGRDAVPSSSSENVDSVAKNDGMSEPSINQMQSNQELTRSNTLNVAIKDDHESNNIANSRSLPIDRTDQVCKSDRPRKLSLPLNLRNDNLQSGSAQRNDLKLNLCNASKDSSPTISTPSPASKPNLGSRKKLLLTFTNHPLPVVSEDIDTSLVLEKQGWYHGSISRFDAESLLRHMKEGSYLIRNCESTKQDYSLSLKSAKGFMHMKIVKQHDGYVLGVFSKPFTSIPEMVKHYSINKLPIRGAEHMSLLYPVIDQLL